MTQPPEPPQIDVRRLPPDAPMERAHTAALITHLNQSADARIQVTKANVNLWHDVLRGRPFGDVLRAAEGYYRHYDPKIAQKDALSIGLLGHLLREQAELEERRHRVIEPRKGSRMPRHVLERLQARGILTDRDPNNDQ